MTAIARVARFGRPVRSRLALALAAGIAAAACAIGLAAVSAWLISRAAEQPPVLHLLTAVTAVRAFGIGRGVLRYAERLAAHDAAFRVLLEIRVATFQRLARLAPAGLAELRSADLLVRLVTDVDRLSDTWLRVLLPYGEAAVVLVGTVLLIALIAPAAGVLLAIGLLVATVGAPAAALTVSRRAERSLAPERSRLAAAAVELLRAGPELIVAGASSRALADVATSDARLAAAERRTALGVGVAGLVAGVGTAFSVWASLAVGIVSVADGSLAGVLLAVVALVPLAAHEVAAPLGASAGRVPGVTAAAARVVDVLDRADPVSEPAAPEAVPDGPLGLRARSLRLRYPGAATDALGPLDLDLAPGSRGILVGPSGSGKSTLVAACLRFLDPVGGRLELVGQERSIDITAAAGDAVRRSVAACLQDPHLFDASVEENLRIGRPDASRAELEAVLADVGLSTWVQGLPDGLGTRVGEHGAHVSGGQRQRLGMARTLLALGPLLILDEPTEHLDEPAARDLVARIALATEGRSVLVLTHRPELFDATWVRVGALQAVP